MSMTEGDCATDTKEECNEEYDTNKIGLWICAIILIIIFSLILWWGFCSFGGNGGCGRGRGRDGCRDGGRGEEGGFGGAGIIGAFLLWLIIIIIFIAAVYKCGWAAIIVFLILFIILIAIGWWWWAGRGEGERDHRRRSRSCERDRT
jgi:hypothetical protein